MKQKTPKQLEKMKIERRRTIGRPKSTWKDTVRRRASHPRPFLPQIKLCDWWDAVTSQKPYKFLFFTFIHLIRAILCKLCTIVEQIDSITALMGEKGNYLAVIVGGNMNISAECQTAASIIAILRNITKKTVNCISL